MLQRRLLLPLSVVALWCLNFVATRWLPSLRLIVWAFFAGCALALVLVLAAVLLTVNREAYCRPSSDDPIRRLRPLAFTAPAAWAKEIEASALEDTYLPTPLYPPSFVISEALDGLLDTIAREFIYSWYGKISQDQVFPLQVNKCLRYVVAHCRDRLLSLDVVEIFIGRIVPLLTAHLNDFSAAEKAVRGKRLDNNLTESEELDLAIASKYRDGKLHPAASLGFSDMKLAQQDHLRNLVAKVLVEVMPEKERRSRCLGTVVKEIVACAVLYPVVTMLSDPDTWNRLVLALGRSTLQDRKTVRKVRAALDQHATPRPAPAVQQRRRASLPESRTHFIRLAPNDDERTYERFIRAIRQCNNLSDARRFRAEITAQLKKDAKAEGGDGWGVYLKRLENGKRLVDQRVAYLSAGTGAAAAGQAKAPVSAGAAGRPARLESDNLEDVLRDTAGLSYFMEHMDRKRRLALVQFWLVVDGLRTPLEEDLSSEEEEDEQATAASFPPWTQSDRNDLAQIHDAYLSIPELHISQKSVQYVKEFLKAGAAANQQQYARARSAILKAQSGVYREMQRRDWPQFKANDLFYKYLASDDAAATQQSRPAPWLDSSSLDPPEVMLSSRHSFDAKGPSDKSLEDWDFDPMSQSRQSIDDEQFNTRGRDVLTPQLTIGERRGNQMPESGIVEAMEAALNDIIEQRPTNIGGRNSPRTSVDILDASDSPRSSLDLPRSEKSGKSGKNTNAPKEAAKKQPPSIASLGLISASKGSVFQDDDGLFWDEEIVAEGPPSSDEEIAEDFVPPKQDEDEEVHQAAPGDLGLAEAIATLSYDIEKLITQEAIIDSLYRKAELTNNTVELRILKKSKTSLQREIRRKELQRQQYIVQESDNSLFGRSSVKITSTMVGSENGQEFALYIVQVRRNGGEQLPAAEWIVARRYSEFFQLHQQLKRFFSVRQLDFPRRRMVMKLQKDFLEKRRAALEKYLQSLILLPEVCRSIEFRAFLSQQEISAPRRNPATTSTPSTGPPSTTATSDDRRDIMTRLYNSIADGMEDVLGNLPILDQLSVASANLIAAATGQSGAASGAGAGAGAGGVGGMTTAETIAEAEEELSAFEENRDVEPFVKPICDLFLEAFELNRRSNWFRGRAVVVVLHQLLGSTIERKMRDQAKILLDEDSLLEHLQRLTDAIVSRSPSPLRTPREKEKTKKEANFTLATLIPDVSASVVGRANAQAAARKLFATLNNRRLNASLINSILDELVAAVFGDARALQEG